MSTTNFNEKHPELREGEMFLTNCDKRVYQSISWRSKRKGMTAYTIHGEIIKSSYRFFPVFVQKQEYDEDMKKYRND